MNADLKKRKVLIFGSGIGGHHLKYASIIIDGFHENGYEVFFASSRQTFESLEYDLILKNHKKKFSAIKYAALCAGGLTQRFEKSLRLFILLFRHKRDIVFIPYLDNVFYVFGVLGGIMKMFGWRFPEMYGILMNCDFTYPEQQHINSRKLKEWLFNKIAMRGPFKQIFLIDEVAYERIWKKFKAPHLCYCPDPVDIAKPADKDLERSKLGIPLDAKVVGAFGLLSEGKGVDHLIRAFFKRPLKVGEYLLIMGKQTAGLQSKIKQLLKGSFNYSNNIVLIDRFVSDEELLSAISSVDVVAVTYPFHMGSASFLIRAAAADKPVLGSDIGWIGNVMTKYRLGRSCNVLDEASLMAGLDWAFDNPQDNCQDAKAFAAKHTIEKFKDIILSNSAE